MKNKRGFGLEMTIMFFVIVFSLTFLIVNVSVLLSLKNNINVENFLSNIELDQIGEDYIYYLNNNDGEDFLPDTSFVVSTSKIGEDYYLKVNNENKMVLEIKAYKTGENIIIKSWRKYEY